MKNFTKGSTTRSLSAQLASKIAKTKKATTKTSRSIKGVVCGKAR